MHEAVIDGNVHADFNFGFKAEFGHELMQA